MTITDQVQWTGLGASNSGVHSIVAVDVTATVIAVTNLGRVSVIIQNQSAGDVYIGFDDTVTTSLYFIRLRQYDAYEINAVNMYVGAIYGVVAGPGSSNVSVGETSHT